MQESGGKYAPVIVRLGMSAVFLWFGFSQFANTANFLGYLPDFLFKSKFASEAVMLNGSFEIIFGIMLAAGVFTKWVALLLGVHLVMIASSLGYSETAVRDFGLALATLSIFFEGEDIWCMDYLRKKGKKTAQ